MCCVIPPNSFSATFDLRIASSSEVLPWSTWPMTVTTGGRSLSCVGSRSSSSTTSPSTERTSRSKLNLSATSFAAVGSSSSLTVAMTPSSTNALITSPDFRRIFSASSPTVTDSGTRISSRLTSAGGAGGASTATAAAGRPGAAGATGPAGAAGWAGREGRWPCGDRRNLGHERDDARLGSDLRLAIGDERGLGCDLRRGLRLDDRRRRLDLSGRLLEGDLRGLLRPRCRLRRDRRAVGRRGVLGRPRLRDALGLRLLGQLTATTELDAQRIRERRVEGAHRAQPLVTHLLGGDHELLAGHPEFLRELHQLYLCRHSPLTSSEAFSPVASDGRASITGSPGLAATARTAAPRTPEVRPPVASASLASQGLLNAWPSRARPSARSRHEASGHTYAPRPGVTPSGSATTTPSRPRTSRTSARLGRTRRHPRHVRRGSRFMRARSSPRRLRSVRARGCASPPTRRPQRGWCRRGRRPPGRARAFPVRP